MAGEIDALDCRHCRSGKPIERIESPAGNVNLCLEGVLDWFVGKDVTWWEERHSPFADHITKAIKAARKREFDRLMFSSLGKEARQTLGIGASASRRLVN